MLKKTFGIPQEKFNHTTGEKNWRWEALKRVRGKFYFTCITPPTRPHNSVPREIFSGHDFFHGRKLWVCAWLPSLYKVMPKRSTSFYPIQNAKVCGINGRLVSSWQKSSQGTLRASNVHGPCQLLCGLPSESQEWVHLAYESPQQTHSTSNTLGYLTYKSPLIQWPVPCVHLQECQEKAFVDGLVSICRNPIGMWRWRRAYKPAFNTTLGRANEKLLAMAICAGLGKNMQY